MDELKELLSILKKEKRVILITGETFYLNQLFLMALISDFIKKYKKSKVVYFYCKGPLLSSFEFLNRMKGKTYVFQINNFDEQYCIVNVLLLLLNADYYKNYSILIVFDDFVSHYFVAPISRHKTAGGTLLAEQLAILKILSDRTTACVVITSYLLSDKRPLLWKIFSKYIDTVVTIHENNGLINISLLNENLTVMKSCSIELDELVGSIEFENA